MADAHVSPTMPPLAMLDRVTTTLLLRLFLPGTDPDVQHTRDSCFMTETGEYWGDFTADTAEVLFVTITVDELQVCQSQTLFPRWMLS